MFGYIVPAKGELKIKDFEIFKGYYCSLCKEIGKKSSISKIALTYDMTFLSILLSALYSDKEKIEKKFCPIKLRSVNVIPANPYIEYSAEMNILLGKRKLVDNYKDDRSYSSLILSSLFSTKKISEDSLTKIKEVDNYMNEITVLEKNNCSEIDLISNNFAKATEAVFAFQKDNNEKILKHIGYNIGKWIYIIDAVNDLNDDIKKNSYNPLKKFAKSNSKNDYILSSEYRENIYFTLIKCLDEASKAFELLDIKKNKELIENIIYLGLKDKTDCILKGGNCNEKSIRSFRDKRGCFTR